ncbi:sodium-coupled monocarboxylate transporter 1-like isoform X2 [Daphnia pulex]|nr:sodium-coupled monocarboxylate transporter 1-like isoform X2 [Daphnia pulex]
MYWWIIVAAGLSIPVSVYVYLPFYHQLQLDGSIHQYLEMRFSCTIRQLISILYIFKTIFYLAVMVYGPSLALKQVTGLQENVSISIMFAVCIFYTAIGGIKAVVWTATFQLCMMYGSIIIVLVKGVMLVGGLENVFLLNANSSRIEFFNFDFDPTTRHTVWSLSIGGFFLFTSMYATDQVFVQRCLALPTLHKARISQCINFLLLAGIISLCCLTGLVTYAFYFDCAPLKAEIVKNSNEIFPLFVIQTIRKFPGLPGIFATGIFSGVTSILSSNLHAVSLVVLEDLIRPSFPIMRDSKASLVNKMTVIIFGCVTFGVAIYFAKFQISLDSSLSFLGAMAGIILGVFSLGMFVPWSNSTGAGFGAIISFAIMMLLGISTQIAKTNNLITNDQMKLLITDNCPSFNSTDVGSPSVHFFIQKADAFVLLRISYLWYTVLSVVIVLIIGTIGSILSEPQDPAKLNPKLLYRVNHNRLLNKAALQPSDETDGATVIRRQRNGILLWELPRRLSPIIEVNLPDT